MTFKLKINPGQQNCLAVRLWGDDASADWLILFCQGKRFGGLHLGDIGILDMGDDSGEAACEGWFSYRTVPLPLVSYAVFRGYSTLLTGQSPLFTVK